MIRRKTPARPFEHRGVGLHTGARSHVVVAPAAWGTGIVFRRRDRPRPIVPAQIEYARAAGGCSTLSMGPVTVGTVEHLLAALFGAGITDAEVAVHGPELPGLDGSAAPWAASLAAVGALEGPPALVLVLRAPVRVEAGASWASLAPAPHCEVAVEVDYDDPQLPRGSAAVVLVGDRFREEVAWARTFALESEVARLRAAGRGKGASLDNTVIWGRGGATNPKGVRAADEPVRHKLLDAIGDLALLGLPVQGKMTVHRGSHQLHHQLLRALLDRTDAWEELTAEDSLATPR